MGEGSDVSLVNHDEKHVRIRFAGQPGGGSTLAIAGPEADETNVGPARIGHDEPYYLLSHNNQTS